MKKAIAIVCAAFAFQAFAQEATTVDQDAVPQQQSEQGVQSKSKKDAKKQQEATAGEQTEAIGEAPVVQPTDKAE